MAVSSEKLEASLELALVALGQVCQSGTNEEKIAASKELVSAVNMAGTQLRKEAVAARVLPLLEVVTRNLSGQLTEGDSFAPVYSLDLAQQGSLIMAISKELS